MKINELLNKLNIQINVCFDIKNVTNDSRKCNENSLYISMYDEYLEDAVGKGIKVVVSDKYIKYHNLVVIYVKDVKSFYFKALKEFYGNYDSYIIGITGTCGKTTTVTLLYETLKLACKNTLLISSNGNFLYYDEKEEYLKTNNTTPNIEIIYELMNKYAFNYVIIEVSSQGLMSDRLEGINFDLAAFLNLSNEHLDYHGTISNYLAAKLKLFKNLKSSGIALVNFNSKYKEEILKLNIRTYSFGITQGDYQIDYLEGDLETMKVNLSGKWISSSLTGAYNAENISAVNAILNVINISNYYLEQCLISGFKVNGRLEIIKYHNNQIIVDFAHTEKEVEVLLKHLKRYCKNKLYIVIGCGGNRDKFKRPIIGRLSTIYGDYVIFTEDNSRNEKSIDIITDMTKDLITDNYIIIINRMDAVKMGISLLNDNDILVIVGMGTDDLKILNGVLTNE